jgi:predicted dehydrogenase
VVTAPNALHVLLAPALLAADISVLPEKPMATESADAEAIVAAARRSAGVLPVAYQHRLRRVHERAREALWRRAVGEVGLVRLHH